MSREWRNSVRDWVDCARAAASPALPVLVVKEMHRHQKHLEQRMTRLRQEALRLIADDPKLDRRFRLMLTTTGIAETSALQILGELAVLEGVTGKKAVNSDLTP